MTSPDLERRLAEMADLHDAWDKYELTGTVPAKIASGETAALLREAKVALSTAPAGTAPQMRKALEDLLNGYYATWMAARAEVEGAAISAMLFEKEPDVISARKALKDKPWVPQEPTVDAIAGELLKIRGSDWDDNTQVIQAAMEEATEILTVLRNLAASTRPPHEQKD